MGWDVLGHEWAAGLLARQIARGELRHAYLITGPAGVGRRTLALRLVQAVNCLQPPEPGVPCRTCRRCQAVERMQHPDLSVVQSEQEGAILDIDSIRELQRSLILSPYEAPYRAGLLLRFQEASLSAQNALLKTLEEAPARVILILTADSAESLLPTIASRCEQLRLRPMAVEMAAAALQARWSVGAEQAELLAHISGGRIGYALRLLNDDELMAQRSDALQDLWTMLFENRRARFAYVAEAYFGRKMNRTDRQDLRARLRFVLQTWITFWRDVAVTAAGSGSAVFNPDMRAEIQTAARQVSAAEAARQVAALEKALERLNSANLQLMMEVLLLDWPLLAG